MKKVLIVGYFWPYRPGSRRILGLTKYITEFGWQPVILTAPLYEKPDVDIRIIETPYRDALGPWKRLLRLNPKEDIRKQMKQRFGVASRKSSLLDFILTRCGEIINYPDAERGWKNFAVKAGSELLQSENIDVVISIWPVTSHFIARELKNKYKIPWVADFPDLWSQNHNYIYSPLRRLIDRRLELKTLSDADALVTVSEPWAEKQRTLHKGKPVYAITHGFDPETVNAPPAKLTDTFTITYTGAIYARKHDPAKLFAALRDLLSNRVIDPNDIEVRFYGNVASWVEKEIKEYGLSSVIKLYGQVPKDVALQKQRESQLLYITKWQDPQERGAYSGKIFEYLAARRPILATDGSHDVVTDLMNETRAGIDAQSVQDIKDALQKLYQDYKLRGEIAYNGIESKMNKYSHREMARKFSEILDRLAPK